MFKFLRWTPRRQLGKVEGALQRFVRTTRRVVRFGKGSRNEQPGLGPADVLNRRISAMRSEVRQIRGELARSGWSVDMAARLYRRFRPLREWVSDVERRAAGRIGPRAHEILRPLHRDLDLLDTAIAGLYGPISGFQQQLGEMMGKAGMTAYALGRATGIDDTYIRRLVRGEKRNPSRYTLQALATALRESSTDISDRDVEKLYRAAGYSPPESD